jgi:PKD repeat protein
MYSLRKARRARSRGQSLVELALVLPVLLLLTLIALDFGRVYLGYINLQNMARVAANFAADNPTAWTTPGDPAVQAQYRNAIVNDAKATNCSLPVVAGLPVVPTPVFTDQGGNATTTDIGDTATVGISCSFGLITPFISNIVGTNGSLAVSASSAFSVKSGLSGTSGSVGSAPVANFTGTPTSGTAPLIVQFQDTSTNVPTNWAWDFNSDGLTDSTLQDPQATFAVGLHTITLTASNAAGSDTETKTSYIGVSTPPPTVTFTATPASGPKTLHVQFADTSPVTPTAWAWDFDNNGTTDSTIQDPAWDYPVVGTYTVKLTATFPTGPVVKTVPNMITVTVGTCVVPNFNNVNSSAAQGIWNTAGFTTTVGFQQGSLPWTIKSQNQVVGQTIPCNSPITVSKN